MAPTVGTSLVPLGQGSTGTTAAFGNGTARCYAVYMPYTATVNLGLEVTVAGDVGCGFYAFAYRMGTDGKPGTLIGQSSLLPGDAVAVVSGGPTITLPKGWLYLGAELYGVTTTQPTVRTPNAAADSLLPFLLTAPPSSGQTVLSYSATVNSTTLPTTASWSPGGTGCARMFYTIV